MKAILMALVVAVVGFMVPQAAHANNNAWTIAAGGCVPDDATAQAQNYTVATGGLRVKHKGTSVRDIVLTCPITNINPESDGIDVLRLFYGNDADFGNGGASISASIKSATKIEGTLANVCTVTSNSSGQWQSDVCRVGTLDFKAKIYWVEVVIHRVSTSFVPEFNGLELDFAIF